MTGVLLNYLHVRPYLWSTGNVRCSRSENILYFSFSVSDFSIKFEPCFLTPLKQLSEYFFITYFKPASLIINAQCNSIFIKHSKGGGGGGGGERRGGGIALAFISHFYHILKKKYDFNIN